MRKACPSRLFDFRWAEKSHQLSRVLPLHDTSVEMKFKRQSDLRTIKSRRLCVGLPLLTSVVRFLACNRSSVDLPVRILPPADDYSMYHLPWLRLHELSHLPFTFIIPLPAGICNRPTTAKPYGACCGGHQWNCAPRCSGAAVVIGGRAAATGQSPRHYGSVSVHSKPFPG